ncbi:MAG: DUF3048 domain-containing protein, partial [bacterium]|nr:DUF3048 domain-containing protein [bacterium]
MTKKKRNNLVVDWRLLGGVLGTFIIVGIAFLRVPSHASPGVSDAIAQSDTSLLVSDVPLTIPPFLSGRWNEENAQTYPVAVSIDNLDEARPQAGLDKAPLVYETLAEGGITRFLAVFSST